MKFKDYNLELIDDDYSENLAEKDKEENHLFKNKKNCLSWF